MMGARHYIFNNRPFFNDGRKAGFQGMNAMDEKQLEDATPHRPEKKLPPAARRALQEAEERRRRKAAEQIAAPREIGGRNGPNPVRFGDWEVKGIATDF